MSYEPIDDYPDTNCSCGKALVKGNYKTINGKDYCHSCWLDKEEWLDKYIDSGERKENEED